MKPTRPQLLRAVAPLLIAAAMFTGQVAAHAISGAIFTSDAAANVNVNLYASKGDVYLNGGPPANAPCTSAGMNDGTYFFQVTNPSGSVLLSTDTISERQFTVSGGVITSATTHAVVDGTCPGSKAVQLVPFANTPNNGGVYKVWVTRQSDYNAGLGNFGFIPGHTKTDNFRVKPSTPPPPATANLNVYKFYDANANGLWDGTDIPLAGWPMNVSNGFGFNDTKLTQSPDGLATWTGLSVDENPYAVAEALAGGTWVQSASIVDGTPTAASPENPVSGLNLVAGETTEVDFGNYCTVPSGGHTLGYWSNKNGQATMNDGGSLQPELNMLDALNLRNGNGSHFNPGMTSPVSQRYATFRTWILSANATNMAYMLSAQFAAMALNVEAGFVDPAAFYIPYGGTIGNLMLDANALLSNGVCGSTCSTVAAGPLRTDQEMVKNYLDQLNNGAAVVPATPCALVFP